MSPASIISPKILESRANALAAAREFFRKRGVMEVDCPALVRSPPNDAHIDVMSVAVSHSETGYLHTSPEYAMKKLLAKGAGDIYFLGHVYRKAEVGFRHNPEFTMAEWYRVGFSFSQMIEETCDFIRLFLGPCPKKVISYRDAFDTYAGIDPERASQKDFLEVIKKSGIELPKDSSGWGKEVLIDLVLTHIIEPRFSLNELTVLIDYPPEQAALACLVEKEGHLVAERFEIYRNGLELANGYHELSDAAELRRRFERLNTKRDEPYPLDEELLKALQSGSFPPCCGVSVGFDRALMIQENLSDIEQAIPFAWR